MKTLNQEKHIRALAVALEQQLKAIQLRLDPVTREIAVDWIEHQVRTQIILPPGMSAREWEKLNPEKADQLMGGLKNYLAEVWSKIPSIRAQMRAAVVDPGTTQPKGKNT